MTEIVWENKVQTWEDIEDADKSESLYWQFKHMVKCFHETNGNKLLREQYIHEFDKLGVDILPLMKELKKTAWNMGTSVWLICTTYTKLEEGYQNILVVAVENRLKTINELKKI